MSVIRMRLLQTTIVEHEPRARETLNFNKDSLTDATLNVIYATLQMIYATLRVIYVTSTVIYAALNVNMSVCTVAFLGT